MRLRALALALLALPLLPAASAQPSTGVLVGRVVDGDGSPVTAVDRFEIQTMGPSHEVALAADGTFRVEALPGKVTGFVLPLDAGKGPWGEATLGCALAGAPCVEVRAGGTTWLNVTLPWAGYVEGVVRDEEGAPVEGADVRSGVPSGYVSVSTRTDAAGAYRLALAPGPRDLSVTPLLETRLDGVWLACGPRSDESCVRVEANATTRQDVALPALVEVQGVVRDAAGTPVWRAAVRASEGRLPMADTDRDGRYLLHVPPDLAWITVQFDPRAADGLDPLTVDARLDCRAGACGALVPRSAAWLNVTLPRGGFVQGVVRGADGAPVDVGTVVLWDGWQERRSYGNAEFRLLAPAGRHALSYDPIWQRTGAGPPSRVACAEGPFCVEVRPGETTWANLTLPAAGTLRVRPEGRVPGRSVDLHVWSGTDVLKEQLEGEDVVLVLPPGRYAVDALSPRLVPANVRGRCVEACVEVRAGEETLHVLRFEEAPRVEALLGSPSWTDAAVLVEGPLGVAQGDEQLGTVGVDAPAGGRSVAAFTLDPGRAWATWGVPLPDEREAAVAMRNVSVLAEATLGPLPDVGGEWAFARARILSDGARTALALDGALLPPDLTILVDGAPPKGRLLRAASVALLPSAGLAAGEHAWTIRAGGREATLAATTLDEPDDAPPAPLASPTPAPPPSSPPPRDAPLPGLLAPLAILAAVALLAWRRRST